VAGNGGREEDGVLKARMVRLVRERGGKGGMMNVDAGVMARAAHEISEGWRTACERRKIMPAATAVIEGAAAGCEESENERRKKKNGMKRLKAGHLETMVWKKKIVERRRWTEKTQYEGRREKRHARYSSRRRKKNRRRIEGKQKDGKGM